MTTLTIARTTTILTDPSYVAPFVQSILFSWTADSWWTTIGGTGGPVTDEPVIIDILVNQLRYIKADTLSFCLDTESTWFFDGTQLYIHFNHSIVPEDAIIQYGRGVGYSDNDVLYIDNTQYLPLLTDVPAFSKIQDIRNYNALAFLSATATLSNQGGILDAQLSEPTIGNTAILSYVPDDEIVNCCVSSDKVITLGTFFVESLRITPQEYTVSLQDLRKISVKIPTGTFNQTDYPDLSDDDSGAIIPLVYGTHRYLPGIKVDALATGSLDATYRVGEVLSSITSVEVKIDDTWVSRTPSSTDLANGTFTIPNARSSTSDEPYDARVSCVGIPVTYAPDIIVDLYERFLSQEFVSQYYDLATWNAEKVKVSSASLYLNQKTDIFEAIATLQNGIFPSFIFDITPNGKRTIKADDRDRASTFVVESWENQLLDSSEVEDDVTYLFAGVTVAYDKAQVGGKLRRTTNNDFEDTVIDDYQIRNTTEIEALVSSDVEASNIASALALDFSKPTRTIVTQAMGDKFFDVQLYDVGIINTYPNDTTDLYTLTGDRDFSGVVYGQVIEVEPDYQLKTVSIKVRVLQDRPFSPLTNTIIITESGRYLATQDDKIIIGGN